MVISNPEKDRALDDIRRIADALERISSRADAAADTLEDIAAALNRAYPERIQPAQKPTARTAPAPGELSDDELLNLVRAAAARAKGEGARHGV